MWLVIAALLFLLFSWIGVGDDKDYRDAIILGIVISVVLRLFFGGGDGDIVSDSALRTLGRQFLD